MQLKLDENLGKRGQELLQSAGHDAATVAEQGLAGSVDEELIEVCRREQRCLVTLDLDYSNPFRFPPENDSGIAVLRPAGRASPRNLEACLQSLMTALQRETIAGRWIAESNGVRGYSPDAEDPSTP